MHSAALGAFAFLPFRVSWVWLFVESVENAAIINTPEKVSRGSAGGKKLEMSLFFSRWHPPKLTPAYMPPPVQSEM